MNEMTSGSVASVSMPLGKTQSRTQENVDVHGLKPVKNISKAKKKGPYQNSLLEGKMNKLDIEYQDFKNMSPQEFYSAYKIRKQDWYNKNKDLLPKQGKLQEEKLDEDDLIVMPGHNIKRKNGLIPHGQSRVDHEVEMALSDLFQAAKNAKKTYMMLKDRTEDEGIEGWVQEKIIKANDYLNTIREYYEHQQYSMHEDLDEMKLGAGVIAGGMANEDDDLTEVAKSKKQQELFGLVHSVQKGDTKAPSKKIADLARTMSKKAVKDYTSTKHDNLPNRVKD